MKSRRQLEALGEPICPRLPTRIDRSCGCGGGGGDNGSGELRAQEEERQRKIRAATEEVNRIFSGFNDQLYDKVTGDWTKYYLPKVDDQYKDALQTTRASLSERGMLDSSSAALTLGDLAEARQEERGRVGNEGRDFANRYRGNVEDARSGLLALAQGAPDITAIAGQANTRAQALSEPPIYSPLGDLFAKFINQAALARSIGFNPVGWSQGGGAGLPGWNYGRPGGSNDYGYVVGR